MSNPEPALPLSRCAPVKASSSPLSIRQLRVLGEAATRELTWALPAVTREVRRWRARAEAIPAPTIRADALSSLARKRGHTDGAALFCILPRSRDPNLLPLLVAYEIMWDFLDTVNERGAAAGQANGRRLHEALIVALDPDAQPSDYYRYHPWCEDGGYLAGLVVFCQDACRRLPSYAAVRSLLEQETRRAQVLAINHDPDPAVRDRALRAWACEERRVEDGVSWFELTGAASASMTVHALLALAAKPRLANSEIESAHRAYFPWISAATTMLDSYVDQAEDNANGDHSYVAHYPGDGTAVERIERLVRRSMVEANRLPDPERHVLIVACMIAMYLSKDSARAPALRSGRRRLIAAAGPLPVALLPVLRLWRIAYRQSST
jgi:tetraprenyl-beta-curcumene synthase